MCPSVSNYLVVKFLFYYFVKSNTYGLCPSLDLCISLNIFSHIVYTYTRPTHSSCVIILTTDQHNNAVAIKRTVSCKQHAKHKISKVKLMKLNASNIYWYKPFD